jgi:hypothetical protein
MKPLEPPDSLHLQAAQGWCELHAFADAEAELDKIAASLRAHPNVFEVRWQVYANLEQWAGALDIASAIVKLAGYQQQLMSANLRSSLPRFLHFPSCQRSSSTNRKSTTLANASSKLNWSMRRPAPVVEVSCPVAASLSPRLAELVNSQVAAHPLHCRRGRNSCDDKLISARLTLPVRLQTLPSWHWAIICGSRYCSQPFSGWA